MEQKAKELGTTVERLLENKKPELNHVFNMDRIKGKPIEEVEQIWLEYHSQKQKLGMVWDKEKYLLFHQRTLKTKFEVVETTKRYFCEHQNHISYLTLVDSYLKLGCDAPVLLKLSFYQDLQRVFIRGDLQMTLQEAETLTKKLLHVEMSPIPQQLTVK